jgi:hypothetical protein
MTTAPTSSLRLVEECLLRNDDAAWRAFLNAHAGIWRPMCSDADWPLWLPGWMLSAVKARRRRLGVLDGRRLAGSVEARRGRDTRTIASFSLLDKARPPGDNDDL